MSDVSYDSITKSKKDRKTERQKDRKAERQKGRKTERQKDRKTERQIDKRQKDRKTEQKTDTSIYIKYQIRRDLIFCRQFLRKDDFFSDPKESNWNVQPL